MKNILFLVILSAGLIISIPSYAQSEEESVRSLIRNLNKDIMLLLENGGSQADKLMTYAAHDIIYDLKVVNTFNQINYQYLTKEKLSFFLHKMRSSNVTSKRTLGNLDEVFVRGNTAIANYNCNYELYESERLINKGIQYVHLVLKKSSDGTWKIYWMDVLSLDDVTYKSSCICQIYESEGLESVMTETIVPNGAEAEIVEDKFSIGRDTDPRIVKHGTSEYLWTMGGLIYKKNVDGSQGQQLGSAGHREELVLTLLKNDIHRERCNSVVKKVK